MILDQLSELETYKGISWNMDTAIEFLRGSDLGALSEGSHQVDGRKVMANVMSYSTKPLDEASYEAHRAYIDIQIVLEGEELCYYSPLETLHESAEFDEKKDIGFYSGRTGVSFPLVPGKFAIFFPHDAHMPSCNLSSSCAVKKIVMKVAV